MKTHIWNQVNPFPNKVNFVDSNNVLLGYDLEQSCCEHARWVISTHEDTAEAEAYPLHTDRNTQELTIEGYVFDREYLRQVDDDANETYAAVFRLVGKAYDDIKPLYVHLINSHNGYYSHGFTFRAEHTITGVL